MDSPTIATLVQTVAIIGVGLFTLKSQSRERELRKEIQTMKALRDQQVAQYEKKFQEANAKLQAANLQVRVLKGSVKDSDIQAHRGKVWELLRSQEFLTRTVTIIAGIAFLVGVGSVLGALLL